MRLDRLIPLGALLILVGLAAFGIAHVPAWVWHPLVGRGYQLWSGIASDVSEITLPIGMITFAVGWWVKHNCHVPGCPRIAWHPHPEHGHPVCKRKHHPHGDPDHPVWDVHKETDDGFART